MNETVILLLANCIYILILTRRKCPERMLCVLYEYTYMYIVYTISQFYVDTTYLYEVDSGLFTARIYSRPILIRRM